MRRMISPALIVALIAVSFWVSDANAVAANDTFMDKIGDWFVTVGKQQDEKEAMLLRRRSKRVADRMREAAEESMKEFDRKMKESLGR